MNTHFSTGVAGSGKSYQVMEKIKSDPSWGLVCATTGIASINLGTVTLNSAIGYFDTESLRVLQKNGKLFSKLKEIREKYVNLVIDEVSMMDGDQLTILVEECTKAGLGIYLTGDFLQLPPVRAKWAFESPYWNTLFEPNTSRLTKVYRQDEGNFLSALNYARSGSGEAAAALLGGFCDTLNDSFDGTTLISKNAEVDAYNQRALFNLPGASFTLRSRRWGRTRGEWKNIPETLELKVGAYVMLLSNSYNDDGELVYANGDCAHVLDWNPSRGCLRVQLVRTGEVVEIEPLLRDVSRPYRPKPWFRPCYGQGGWCPSPHWQFEKEKFVEGQIEYYPLRLAYASTIHKSQGLSLDRVQLDFTDQFCGQPAMMYVALSRCRTMAGLRLVGTREKFIEQVRVDQKVRKWL